MIILNCVSITILIIFEISLTIFVARKLIASESKIEQINSQLLIDAAVVVGICSKIKDIMLKTNRVVSILTSKKMLAIHTFVKYVLNTIEIIIFIRTLDFSKGVFTYKNIKKVLLAKAGKKLLFKILRFICG